MKRILAASVNAFSILLVLTGIITLALNSEQGGILASLSHPDYLDSPVFETQVSESVNDIFDYIDLKDIFENGSALDLNRTIAQSETAGASRSYSLDYLIKYARSMGYYLNEKNEIRDDGPATVTKLQDEKQHQIRVTYRAYMPNYQPSSPSDGLMSLGKLAQETLSYLAKYYAVRSEFFDQPTNLRFYASYSGDGKSTSYTNAPELSMDTLSQSGKYLYTDSETLELSSNMKTPPNLVPLLQARNPYQNGSYLFAVSIDTDFPSQDAYALAAARYHSHHVNTVVGLVLLFFGLFACAVSFCALLMLTGRSAESGKIHLYPTDRLPSELPILLFLLWIPASGALSRALLASLENFTGSMEHWDYWHGALRLFFRYLFFLPLCLSLARNYKAETLWEYSFLRRMLLVIKHYIRSAALTAPRFYSILLFLLPNLSGLLLIGLLLYRFFTRASLFCFLVASALLLILLAIDFYAWRIATGLSKAVNEQVKSERMKADLITNVSHDLKTPLTSIINYVDLLKREKIENPRAAEYLEVLDQKANRLKTLTEDLVEASKASSGNVSIELTELDYAAMVQQALGEFEEKMKAAKLDVILNVPGRPVLILADGRRLWRVLENLMNNCCKYALRGSRVYVDVREEEDSASCTIKNISEAPLNISAEELTERFVRGDVSRTTEGSGLGLSIAKSLSSLMKGRLEISIDGDLYKAAVILPKPHRNEEAGRPGTVPDAESAMEKTNEAVAEQVRELTAELPEIDSRLAKLSSRENGEEGQGREEQGEEEQAEEKQDKEKDKD